MAKYRQVQVSFWQDSFVLDLTPEEKYFYLYLMTNSKATQIGIYELPKKIIELETGYNRETVDKLLDRFIEYGKVSYSEINNEIMIDNWIKHNWNSSVKVISRVDTELKDVKTDEFIKKYLTQALSIEKDTEKIRYLYGMDTVSIVYPYKDKEKEKEKDKDKEKDKEELPTAAKEYLESTFGSLNPNVYQDLIFYNDKFTESNEIIIEAVDISVMRGKRNWNYAKSIIQSWRNEGLKTLNDVKKHENKGKLQKFKRNDYQLSSEQQKQIDKLGF